MCHVTSLGRNFEKTLATFKKKKDKLNTKISDHQSVLSICHLYTLLNLKIFRTWGRPANMGNFPFNTIFLQKLSFH